MYHYGYEKDTQDKNTFPIPLNEQKVSADEIADFLNLMEIRGIENNAKKIIIKSDQILFPSVNTQSENSTTQELHILSAYSSMNYAYLNNLNFDLSFNFPQLSARKYPSIYILMCGKAPGGGLIKVNKSLFYQNGLEGGLIKDISYDYNHSHGEGNLYTMPMTGIYLIDNGFLHEKVLLGATYVYRKTFRIQLTVTIPSLSGATTEEYNSAWGIMVKGKIEMFQL